MNQELIQLINYHCQTKKKGAIIAGGVLIALGIATYAGLMLFAPDGRGKATMSLAAGLVFGMLGLLFMGLGLLVHKIDPIARIALHYPSNIRGYQALETTVTVEGVSVQTIESISLFTDGGQTLGLRIKKGSKEEALQILQQALPHAKRYE